MYYANLAGATPSVVSNIRNIKLNSLGYIDYYGFNPNLSGYRAYFSAEADDWGSNQWKADIGNINKDVANYGIVSSGSNDYLDRALDIVHYFHGINPLNMVYLTNMESLGAGESVSSIYHEWFEEGGPWADTKTSSVGGPAPGYVTGGAFTGYTDEAGGCTLTPPCSQPFEKSFKKEWNSGYPVNSWSITEPDIYIQSAYIELLSQFTSNPITTLPVDLIHFNAYKMNENAVRLDWQTTASPDIKSFIIERSFEGNHFNPIDTISSRMTGSYSYLDTTISNRPSNYAYYRIRLNKQSNDTEYSQVEAVSFSNKTSNAFFIIINTENGSISVIMEQPGQQPVNLEIYDISGRQLLNKQITGNSIIHCNTINFRNQVVIAKITFDDGTFSGKKIFVQ